jgi:hypothetical protein
MHHHLRRVGFVALPIERGAVLDFVIDRMTLKVLLALNKSLTKPESSYSKSAIL